MNILHDLGKLLGTITGNSQRAVQLGGGGSIAQHAPLSPQQVANANAQIAADGAKMYMQAHPGQPYQIGQNGETYDGGINMDLYHQLTSVTPKPTLQPATAKLLSTRRPLAGQSFIPTGPQPQGNAASIMPDSPNLQAPQNSGRILLPTGSHLAYANTLQPAYIKGHRDVGS